MVTTSAWNQHGNTFESAYINSIDDEITFIFKTDRMTEKEIENERQKIIKICNSLNGQIKLQVTLNSGSVFNRIITFYSSPIFPLGFRNRNRDWQRVRLLFEVNDPFWRTPIEMLETFLTLKPLVKFSFTMSEEDPLIFGDVTSSNTVINDGQVETPVQITIVGKCENPTITNETTGEYIKFKSLEMQPEDRVYINTAYGRNKVQLNNENAFHLLNFSSTFFSLVPGENIITFTTETAANDATFFFNYHNLYITI